MAYKCLSLFAQETSWAKMSVSGWPQLSIILAGSCSTYSHNRKQTKLWSVRQRTNSRTNSVSSGVQPPACSSTGLYGPQLQLHSDLLLCAWLKCSFISQTSRHLQPMANTALNSCPPVANLYLAVCP